MTSGDLQAGSAANMTAAFLTRSFDFCEKCSHSNGIADSCSACDIPQLQIFFCKPSAQTQVTVPTFILNNLQKNLDAIH